MKRFRRHNRAEQLTFRDNSVIAKMIRFFFWAVVIWFIGVFIFWPLIQTVRLAVFDNGKIRENLGSMLFNAQNMEALGNTVLLGFLTVIVCGAVGSFFAFYTTMVRPRGHRILHSFLFLPFVLPGVISVLAFIQIYADTGVINQSLKALFKLDSAPFQFVGLPAILVIHAATQYVIFYLQMRLAFQSIDLYQVEAAKQLGASNFTVFKDVFWPELKPYVLTASLLTFVSGISAFSAPYLVGGRFTVMSSRIAASKVNNDLVSARLQVLILFGLSAILMIIYQLVKKNTTQDRIAKSSRRGKLLIRSRKVRGTLHTVTWLLLLYIFIPLLSLIIFSFGKTSEWMTKIMPTTFTLENYERLFGAKRAFRPLANSLKMSLIAAVVVCVLSVIFLTISDRRKGPLSQLGRFGYTLPAAMPVSTLGIMLISAFNIPNPLIGNQILVGTFYIMPLAYAIIALPTGFRTVQSAFEQFPADLAYAAADLGASARRILFDIRLPMARPAIITTFLYVFMRSLGEYNISALLFNLKTEPISIRMISSMHDYNMGLSMAYATIILTMSLVISFTTNYLETKRIRRVSR